MKVVEFADEAKADVARIDAWWRANRRAAPDLFANELDKVTLALEDNPALGLHYQPRPGVRRMLLTRPSLWGKSPHPAIPAAHEPERVPSSGLVRAIVTEVEG